MEPQKILDLKLENDGFDAHATIRDYFKLLLLTLWREEESFSGECPFGDSDWQYDIYKPLVKAEVVPGEIDEDGYLETVDISEADKLIYKLIECCTGA